MRIPRAPPRRKGLQIRKNISNVPMLELRNAGNDMESF